MIIVYIVYSIVYTKLNFSSLSHDKLGILPYIVSINTNGLPLASFQNRILVKFGEGFNLAIWQFKLPNQKLTNIISLACSQPHWYSWLASQLECCMYHSHN